MPNGDPCNQITDETKAIATLNVIHQRIFNFILNTAPIFNFGYSFLTPDTFNMIASYLETKIISDLNDRAMLDYVLEGTTFVAIAASKREPDDGIEFNPSLVSDPEDRLKYIIRQMLQKIMQNASSESEILNEIGNAAGWSSLARNYFEDDVNSGQRVYRGSGRINRGHQYDMLSYYLYSGVSFGTGGILPRSPRLPGHLIIPDQADPGLHRLLRRSGLDPESGTLNQLAERFKNERFLGFVPMPLLVGLQVIYYDKVVDLTGKFPKMAYYARERITAADSQLKRDMVENDIQESLTLPSEVAELDTIETLIARDRARMLAEAAQREQAQPEEQQPEVQRPAAEVAREDVEGEEEEEPAQPEQPNQQQQQNQQAQQRPRFPVTVGGRRYPTLDSVQVARNRYGLLIEKVDTIRRLKGALETRLRLFGRSVAASEKLYKEDGTGAGGNSLFGKNRDSYNDFIRRNPREKAYRGAIQELVVIINRLTSLQLSQYGSDVNTRSGSEIIQRRFNEGTDLLISVEREDTISTADLNIAREYHARAPYARSQAMGFSSLGFVRNKIAEAMRSTYAGMQDGREKAQFYNNIVAAADSFIGFKEAPPRDRAFGSPPPPYSFGTDLEQANRNNTVIGILASITYETRRLIDLGVLSSLGLNEWNPQIREQTMANIAALDEIIARGE